MAFLQTTTGSITGKILYSDCYVELPKCRPGPRCLPEVVHVPLLNKLEAIPVFGHLAAAFRIVLSIIHMIGHSIAAVVCWDKCHFCHVAKGGTELLRGIVVMIPIVGRCFVWLYDARPPLIGHNCRPDTNYSWSFFIVKIYNPEAPDKIDAYLLENGKHPLVPAPILDY